MSWNLDEFNNLCKQKEFPLSTEFQHTHGCKIEQADLHAKRAVEVWNEIIINLLVNCSSLPDGNIQKEKRKKKGFSENV
jgi:hypothetical protein